MKKKKLLFYFYNRLNDPLLQSNIFHYISALAKTGLYEIAIITYEDVLVPLSDPEKKNIHASYKAQNIHWYPLTWHAGSNLFLKVIDVCTGFFTFFRLACFQDFRHVISLGSIAGSFVYLFSKAVRIKFYLYQFEPHSEYALDNKLWTANSLQYKLLQACEKKSVQQCSVVSSGTSSMQSRLKSMNLKGKFFRVASVVNDVKFKFDLRARENIRSRFGISESDRLVIYPGKLNELYCTAQELLNVFKTMHRQNTAFKFLAITPGKAELDQLLATEDAALKKIITVLPAVSHNDMPGFLTAADFGIVGVLPGPSKQFMSPIKVGEYLCCGLPYLICSDLLEDSAIATQRNVGVVVNDFSEAEISKACTKINALMQEPKQALAERCREAGIFYRGFDRQYEQFKLAIDALTE